MLIACSFTGQEVFLAERKRREQGEKPTEIKNPQCAETLVSVQYPLTNAPPYNAWAMIIFPIVPFVLDTLSCMQKNP